MWKPLRMDVKSVGDRAVAQYIDVGSSVAVTAIEGQKLRSVGMRRRPLYALQVTLSGRGPCVLCSEPGIHKLRSETGGCLPTRWPAGSLQGGSSQGCSAPRPATGPSYLAALLTPLRPAGSHLSLLASGPQFSSAKEPGDSPQTQTHVKWLRWPRLFTLIYPWPRLTLYEGELSRSILAPLHMPRTDGLYYLCRLNCKCFKVHKNLRLDVCTCAWKIPHKGTDWKFSTGNLLENAA